ncbi:hypothetical protein JCM33374_g3677 [Metschnikowia sp. JCM 33374]|nr:hypothetical protein JCM33374_g3677 [Metschnikowia sp. JCM 33374]
MSEQIVKSVLDSDAHAFRNKCCQWYVDSLNELGLPTKVEESVVIVGSSQAKAYVKASSKALKNHRAVLIAGKGGNLGKAVAIVEQLKQQINSEKEPVVDSNRAKKQNPEQVVQFNKACLHGSLINPAYKPSKSLKNIQLLHDVSSSQEASGPQSSEQTTDDVLREIKGFKTYQVPSVAILLVQDDKSVDANLYKWTKQVIH